MKIALIADVHSNLEAFNKVKEILETEKVEEIWFLGDLVGYGPKPNECVDLLRSLGDCLRVFAVAGNHDLGSIDKLNLADFSYEAEVACSWTSKVLTKGNWSYLENLPLEEEPNSEIILVHGSPRDPVWEYITSGGAALANFACFGGRIAFVGHVHVPFIFEKKDDFVRLIKLEENKTIKLNKSLRYIINPGSVGQPRDGNPRASLMIFDKKEYTIVYKRVDYNVALVQKEMRERGLPLFLVERLTYGI